MGFLLQDMDSMVRTAMAIEREIDDTRSIQDVGTSEKRKESQPSSRSRKNERTYASRGFHGQGHDYQG